mgnify:CR=1 FL=1
MEVRRRRTQPFIYMGKMCTSCNADGSRSSEIGLQEQAGLLTD